jgi:hypothetical protein
MLLKQGIQTENFHSLIIYSIYRGLILNISSSYVHEWLCCMACGEMIECDQSGQLFWIPDDRVRILTGEDHRGALELLQNALVPLFGTMLKEVANLYKKSGPLGELGLGILKGLFHLIIYGFAHRDQQLPLQGTLFNIGSIFTGLWSYIKKYNFTC